MLTIGAFAQLTGLTVKALRHYDELGVLKPAEVDIHSGYRYYRPEQLRTAATISVLRGIGLSIPEIVITLDQPGKFAERIDEFNAAREERRAREDRMLAEGRSILDGYQRSTTVERREAPAQPWVGFHADLSFDSEESEVQAENGRFDAFYGALHASGCTPEPWWWLEFRASAASTRDSTDLVAVTWCIPIAEPAPEELRRALVEHDYKVAYGELPARTESFVRLEPDAGLSNDFTAPHPGVVALMDAVGAEQEIRQVYRMTADGVDLELVASSAS
ncbi:MerR family transcriptional regulator [Gulosibacter macacae]|uniref:MerR family transcriptional regulator n=1 Tax=Gulosibacter macacae TaxID=2488791 RepID=A0A3P3VRY5_9MICO|nr:MerR family transcriptional regulator [Gulosibacter macacae]RRJ85542.1 MerR family transcriptional regulator [Gulosibacter macacae]